MKILSVVAFLLIQIFFIRNSDLLGFQTTERNRPIQVLKSPAVPPIPLASSASVSLFSPFVLTIAQDIRNKEIITASMDSSKSLTAEMPKWVADHYDNFEAEYYTKEKAAYQRSVGWGTGLYRGKPFSWFCYTSTNGQVNFDLSVKLVQGDIKSLGVCYEQDKNFSVSLSDNSEWYHKGTATQIETFTNWIQTDCALPDISPCYTGWMLREVVGDLNKESFLKLTIRGTFPW